MQALADHHRRLAGLLGAAAPAQAGTLVGNPGKEAGVIESVGTKYTVRPGLVLSGDAYDNEMGFMLPEVEDEVL